MLAPIRMQHVLRLLRLRLALVYRATSVLRLSALSSGALLLLLLPDEQLIWN